MTFPSIPDVKNANPFIARDSRRRCSILCSYHIAYATRSLVSYRLCQCKGTKQAAHCSHNRREKPRNQNGRATIHIRADYEKNHKTTLAGAVVPVGNRLSCSGIIQKLSAATQTTTEIPSLHGLIPVPFRSPIGSFLGWDADIQNIVVKN